MLTYKEVIELTQFEYDLLSVNVCDDMPFLTFSAYLKMQEKGYFKGVYDKTMTIGNILKKAVIIEKKG